MGINISLAPKRVLMLIPPLLKLSVGSPTLKNVVIKTAAFCFESKSLGTTCLYQLS